MTDVRAPMFFAQIKDSRLAQYAYIVGSRESGEALVIDPERDVDRYVEIAEAEGLRIVAVAETHIHADFLSGARELADRHGAKLYLSGEGGPDWQPKWAIAGGYDLELLRDGSVFHVGDIQITVAHTPGHTPEHVTFLVRDAAEGEPLRAVTGDFVFVGDLGRPDLLESAAGIEGMMDSSARALYHSVESAMAWPDDLEIWPGHGAGSACGKALGSAPHTTWGAEKLANAALQAAAAGEQAFVDFILEGQPEPPLYFARMKALNRDGVPRLPSLPEPRRLAADELVELEGRSGAVVVDTRPSQEAFMSRHVAGSLYAPLDDLFHTVVGSYVDPDDTIYLIAAEHDIDALVRNLIRIGFDEVGGWLPVEALDAYEKLGGTVEATEVTDFEQLRALVSRPETHVLDVRSANERGSGDGLSGAAHIAHTMLPVRIDEVPTGGVLAVYCQSGRRAARAVSLLEREGYRPVLVDDDLENWMPRGQSSSRAIA